MSSKISVLITGGAGYVGSHVASTLSKAGHQVSVLDDLSTGFRSSVPLCAKFYEGDVSDGPLVAHILSTNEVAAILHLAASVIAPESVVDPLKYYRNNVLKAFALIERAVQSGVRHFIFASSAAVYGIPRSIPVAEEAECMPSNPYGSSKLIGEMMLRDVAVGRRFNFCILRYFNVAGAEPETGLGQSTIGATQLVKVALEAALGKREQVEIFGNDYPTPDGTGIRDYVHVTDLANAHVSALQKIVTDASQSLVLNCGSGRGNSVLEVIDMVERVVGRKVRRQFSPRRPGDSPILVADNRRIRSVLGWTPRVSDLESIVSHAFVWEKARIR